MTKVAAGSESLGDVILYLGMGYNVGSLIYLWLINVSWTTIQPRLAMVVTSLFVLLLSKTLTVGALLGPLSSFMIL